MVPFVWVIDPFFFAAVFGESGRAMEKRAVLSRDVRILFFSRFRLAPWLSEGVVVESPIMAVG